MKEANDNKSVMSVDDIALRWGCTRKLVIEAIREGRLKAFKVGKRVYRIAVVELERFERVA